jgi:hypothetical protein
MVTIHGTLSSTSEGAWLVDHTCPGVFVTDGYTWPSALWITGPDQRGILHSVDFQFDQESALRLRPAYKRLQKRVPEECILATLTGLFETRRDWSQSKRVYANGTQKFLGFGHLGDAPAQLVAKSWDGATAAPGCNAKRKADAH